MISFHKLKSVWLHGTVVEIMSLPQQGECQHSSPVRQHVDTPCFEKFLNRLQVSGRRKQSLFLHKSDRLIMRNPHYRRAIHAAVVSVCQSCHRQPFFSGFCRGVKIQQTLLLAEYWPAARAFPLETSLLLPPLLLPPGFYKQHLNGKTSELVIAGESLATLTWPSLCTAIPHGADQKLCQSDLLLESMVALK